MRSLPLVLASLFLCAHGLAQDAEDPARAAVIAYWDPGDTRTWEVQRVKEGRNAATSSYRITMKVLDATDSSYVAEFRTSGVEVKTDLPEEALGRAVMQRVLRASEGLRVLCTTDETGIPLALTNEQEIAEHGRIVLAGILDLAATPAERLQMEQSLGEVLSAHELAQAALEDIGNILFAFGVEYELGKPERVTAEVPNPLGGTPLPTIQEFTLTALDTATGVARMRMSQQLDRKLLQEQMNGILKGIGGDPEDMRRKLMGMRITDTMDITVDLAGAWTTYCRLVRETILDGTRETDTRTYTLH